MTGSVVVVRAPRPDEAAAIARCQLDCWRDAYADLVDPVRLAHQLAAVDARVARWSEILAGPVRVRVATDDGALVGLAAVLAAAADRPAHVGAMYTRRACWGTGLGQRLLDQTLGNEPATLEVFRDNERAVRFYARNGFVPDGTAAEEAFFGAVEIGMVRPGPG